MKFGFKKMLLMAAMIIILIAFLIMVSHRNLVGEVACLGATGALFMATRRKQNH